MFLPASDVDSWPVGLRHPASLQVIDGGFLHIVSDPLRDTCWGDGALQPLLVVVASLGEDKVGCLWRAVVAEDNLGRFRSARVLLLRAVPCPFPHLVAIVGHT